MPDSLVNRPPKLVSKHLPAGVIAWDLPLRLYYSAGSDELEKDLKSFTAEVAKVCERQMASKAHLYPHISHIGLPVAGDDGGRKQKGTEGKMWIWIQDVYPRADQGGSALDSSRSELSILYEDQWMVVVNKPWGVPSVGESSDSENKQSVLSRIQEQHCEARVVHRLDEETSGVLVVALSRVSSQRLNESFRQRAVEKTYVARVLGSFNTDSEGSVEVWMSKDPNQRLAQKVVDDGAGLDGMKASWSCTQYCVLDSGIPISGVEQATATNVEERRAHVIALAETQQQEDGNTDYTPQEPSTKRQKHSHERNGSADWKRASIVKLEPITGKTHQLRLHMDYIGHPILGDTLYGQKANVEGLSSRLCLHAYKLTIPHPQSQQRMTFVAPLPDCIL